MGKAKRDPGTLTPLRRALYDAIQSKGVSEAYLSRLVRGNGYFINKYLWDNNPQELRLEEGVKLAEELGINPEDILGEPYLALTEPRKSRVIQSEEGVDDKTTAGNKKMVTFYDLAVEALSKLSAEDMVKAVSEATDLSTKRGTAANPRRRETTL